MSIPKSNGYNYVRLWDVSDMTDADTKSASYNNAIKWHGYPVNPIRPNPIPVSVLEYTHLPRPVHSNRRPKRKSEYSNLSNYNVTP